MVPELIGSAETETSDLRDAVLAAGTAIGRADRWVAVGVAGRGEPVGSFGPDVVGTYRGFGADVSVRLGGVPTDEPAAATDPDPCLPLAVLTVGWLRDRVAARMPAQVHIVPAAPTGDERAATIATLVDAIGAQSRVALIVVGDGACTLTERAPGGLHPDAGAAQQRLDDLLAAADLDGLADLDEPECARVGIGSAAAWRIGAGALRTLGGRLRPAELYRGHPFGVGYWVGTWLPEAA